MKGDFSQLDPRRDERYDAVLHQQGRLWLDADWNADVFERLARLDRETRDVVGLPAGFPGDAFIIGPPAASPPSAVDDFAISGGPGTHGRAYVDGLLGELTEPASYRSQPDFPNPPPFVAPEAGHTLYAIVYLEVWRRLLTYLQDPSIREIALGGPDTALRLKTIAQVKVLTFPTDKTVTDPEAAIAALSPTGTGTLSTFLTALPVLSPPDLCTIPDPGGYSGFENRLYRIEIQTGGDLGVAQFKWSRNNASDAVGIVAWSADGTTLTLSSLGRDAESALREGDLVEIGSDATDLGPAVVGFVTSLASDPDPDTLTVKLADPLPPDVGGPASPPVLSPPAIDAPRVLRRWNGCAVATATPIPLEDGISIAFGGNGFQAGDYWTFTARSIDASIEPLLNAKPAGIVRHRAPLAVVSWSADQNDKVTFGHITSCRKTFSALVDSGTSREAMHVSNVQSMNSSNGVGSLENDLTATPTQLAGGIQFVLDAPQGADPASVTPATCTGTIEVAFPPPPQNLTARVNVGGTFSAETGSGQAWIGWCLAPGITANLAALRALASAPAVPMRFTLRGDVIWGADPAKRYYLDGNAFGTSRKDDSIALRFPSGNGIPGGDFETWFTLVPDLQQQLSVYVADIGPQQMSPVGPARIAAFPATGEGVPRVLTDPSNITSALRGVALDGAGSIYAVSGQSVFVYGAHATSGPPTKTLTELGIPYGIAVGADGTVYVADRTSPIAPQPLTNAAGIAVYAGGVTKPTLIQDPNMTMPTAIAVDSGGTLYVTNLKVQPAPYPSVVILAKGQTTATIAGGKTGLAAPYGVALGPGGEIFVANAGTASPPMPPSITVYANDPGNYGNVAPVRTISGPNTGLIFGQIWSCAVDSTGYLYVVSATNVLVFAPNAQGEKAAPLFSMPVTEAAAGPPPPVMFIAVALT